MPLYQVIILAIIQGATEFLPISSSAHLAMAPWLLGWRDQGLAFDIALHLGTLAAVLIYFFKDWVQIVGQGFGMQYGHDPALRKRPRMLWMLALGSIPVGVAGLLLKQHAETTFRNPWVIGGMLIGVGLLMWVAELAGKRRKQIDGITWADALVIGVAQALAVVPGTSRSGITMTAGLFRDVDRAAAARFSFLLSTPAIGAAGLKAVYDGIKESGAASLFTMDLAVGLAVSAITGLLAIGYFLKFLRTRTFKFFIVYRIVFGILVIALAVFRP